MQRTPPLIAALAVFVVWACPAAGVPVTLSVSSDADDQADMRAIRRLGEAERQHASADAASLRRVAEKMDRDAHAEEAQENLELEDAHALAALFKRNHSLLRSQRDANQIRLVAVQEEQ